MKLVRFHHEAEQELAEHEAWYRQRSEVAAQGFLLELDHAIAAVAEAPERWPTAGEASVGMFSLVIRSRFSIVFVVMRSLSRLWPIKVAVLAIGTIASNRGPSTKFWLSPVVLATNPAFSRRELCELERRALLEAWNGLFGTESR